MLITIYITLADYWKLKKDEVMKFYTLPDRYERYFNRFVLPEIGMMKLADITASDIDRIEHNMLSQGYSKAIISMTNALLRKVFHQAAIDRLAKEDVLANLKPVTKDEEAKRIFTREQEIKLLHAFQKTYQPELYTLSMFTGIPYLDLAGCSVNDYSRENKTLRVYRKPTPYFVKTRNATSEARVIPLSEISCRVINFAIKKQAAKNKNFPGNESDLIFTDLYNNRVSRMWPEEYREIRKASGIHDFQLKDLVSNFGVRALKCKVNPLVLKRYIGYKGDKHIDRLALACHNNVKDIQASDDYYRERLENE